METLRELPKIRANELPEWPEWRAWIIPSEVWFNQIDRQTSSFWMSRFEGRAVVIRLVPVDPDLHGAFLQCFALDDLQPTTYIFYSRWRIVQETELAGGMDSDAAASSWRARIPEIFMEETL